MHMTIAKNDTHLIEVQCWGYQGKKKLFEDEAVANLPTTGLSLGDDRSVTVETGPNLKKRALYFDPDSKRMIQYTARPYISAEAGYERELREELELLDQDLVVGDIDDDTYIELSNQLAQDE